MDAVLKAITRALASGDTLQLTSFGALPQVSAPRARDAIRDRRGDPDSGREDGD
jgi:nucleoid DNA-binding protein